MKALSLFLFIAFAAAAHAEKSVWDQLESGTVDPIHAVITHVELDGLSVTFKPAEGAEETQRICTQDRAINGNFYTEADRALALNLRVQALLRSRDQKKMINLGHYGPWHSCVYPLDI